LEILVTVHHFPPSGHDRKVRLTLVDAKIPLKISLHLRLEIKYIHRILLLLIDKTKFDDIHVVWEHYFQCLVIVWHVCICSGAMCR